MPRTARIAVAVGLVLAAVVAGGAAAPLEVAATTSIVGDVVRAVGGEAISLTVLLPAGADPHTFEPTPREMASLADVQVIFVNGGGLETFLGALLAAVTAPVVSVSEGVTFLSLSPGGQEQGVDPHVWFDPRNVVVWAKNIARELALLDPANAEGYAARALAYEQELKDLDAWIVEAVAAIPRERRKLVSDHEAFGYFVDRYGFDDVGTVIPGLSTLAEPSAQGLAALEDAIRERGVPAIFVGITVNPALAEQVAQDTGARIVFLYTGALSGTAGPAGTYLDLMRYDVRTIVQALGGGP
ncbi:MAG: metal ABC transporter substrate-binding protein [Candidatus Bipolaricaulota bacterium]|jgi:ABC-type Zn uptake system ZnuABC Zn-binding protein ZnuA|nr:metal ABC transporter substrate-binding protein [Candidatus Bipolaricaulota bacterium]